MCCYVLLYFVVFCCVLLSFVEFCYVLLYFFMFFLCFVLFCVQKSQYIQSGGTLECIYWIISSNFSCFLYAYLYPYLLPNHGTGYHNCSLLNQIWMIYTRKFCFFVSSLNLDQYETYHLVYNIYFLDKVDMWFIWISNHLFV